MKKRDRGRAYTDARTGPLYYELIWIFQGLLSRVAQYKRGSFIRPVGGGSLLRKEEEHKKNQIKRIYFFFFPSGKEWEGSGELLGTVSYHSVRALSPVVEEGGLNFLGHDSFVILLLMLFISLLAQDTLCVCCWGIHSIQFSFLFFVLFVVHRLGGCGHLRLQPGERSQFQRHLQLPRQNGPIPQRLGDPVHPGRHSRFVFFFFSQIYPILFLGGQLLFANFEFPPLKFSHSIEIEIENNNKKKIVGGWV